MPWQLISPFCGFSAYGQGFHVIESTSSDEGIRDIESEFKLKVGPNSSWRWFAKKVGEGKY
jgi:hypothetical protein